MILMERITEALAKFKATIKKGFQYIVQHPIKTLLYTAASAAAALLVSN
jgi:DNA-binding MurR/RpiR family transcriptional regulator